jgi:catechol 2,3-dioxygenase-like lactoylglutathione lyase family enzyme
VDAAFKDVGAIILFVADLQRSKVFYQGVLGLEVEFEDGESVGFKIEGLAFIALQVDRARVRRHPPQHVIKKALRPSCCGRGIGRVPGHGRREPVGELFLLDTATP